MLQLLPVTSPVDPVLDDIRPLYESAFPLHEQRTRAGREKLFSQSGYYMYQIRDNDCFAGFTGCWQIGSLFYIEHIAIAPQMRGSGVGQQALSLFCQEKQRVVLEIDPLTDEVAQRRLRFYQHCGFAVNDYIHHHPAYRPEFPPHELVILSYPQVINPEEYQQFKSFLIHHIMPENLL
ncbi:GNAT family N-acetyltransferase [Morganella morganii]